MLSRKLSDYLEEIKKFYPIISVTGPRQAGKTTLIKSFFSNYRYVNFELPNTRLAFTEDPVGFLNEYDDFVIFDEAQHVPELFSYLQVNVDEDRRPARFVISGSQNFLLRKNIAQSLAGRVGVTRLFPLDIGELSQNDKLPNSHFDLIFNGSYPGQYNAALPAEMFYGNYLFSYIQRDVVGLVSPASMGSFDRFLEALAGNAGQLLNYSNLATVVGVSVKTIQNWISILEQSYIVFRLQPYFKNVNRRLVKSPKLYFYDTGLLCHLLKLTNPSQIRSYHDYGSLFENLIIADAYKRTYHLGSRPLYNFFRDSNGKEIDLVLETPSKTQLWEIKATETFHPRLIRPLNKITKSIFSEAEKNLVFGGIEKLSLNEVQLLPWDNVSW